MESKIWVRCKKEKDSWTGKFLKGKFYRVVRIYRTDWYIKDETGEQVGICFPGLKPFDEQFRVV